MLWCAVCTCSVGPVGLLVGHDIKKDYFLLVFFVCELD